MLLLVMVSASCSAERDFLDLVSLGPALLGEFIIEKHTCLFESCGPCMRLEVGIYIVLV